MVEKNGTCNFSRTLGFNEEDDEQGKNKDARVRGGKVACRDAAQFDKTKSYP